MQLHADRIESSSTDIMILGSHFGPAKNKDVPTKKLPSIAVVEQAQLAIIPSSTCPVGFIAYQ